MVSFHTGRSMELTTITHWQPWVKSCWETIPKGKLQRRCLKGVWLGKLGRDDSHVIGTSAGAIAVRSIRRLPEEAQIDNELMSEMKGIPWQPRDGVRHKITRELSQPAIIPAPASAGNAASAEEVEEVYPNLVENEEKADEEGATAVAAAQVEELIGPMDEEGEHLSANAAGEDDMVDSLTPPPSRLSAAAASCGQPLRGAGWSSSLPSLTNEPIYKSQWHR
jgi:hypothetical protein